MTHAHQQAVMMLGKSTGELSSVQQRPCEGETPRLKRSEHSSDCNYYRSTICIWRLVRLLVPGNDAISAFRARF